jgi:hypothetical protein
MYIFCLLVQMLCVIYKLLCNATCAPSLSLSFSLSLSLFLPFHTYTNNHSHSVRTQNNIHRDVIPLFWNLLTNLHLITETVLILISTTNYRLPYTHPYIISQLHPLSHTHTPSHTHYTVCNISYTQMLIPILTDSHSLYASFSLSLSSM